MRSGTHLLSDILNNHPEVYPVTELLHPNYFPSYKKSSSQKILKGVTNLLKKKSKFESYTRKNVDFLIHKHIKSFNELSYTGGVIHKYQMNRLKLEYGEVAKIFDKVIVLERLNKAAQCHSLIKAATTNVWASTNEEEANGQRCLNVEVNQSYLERYIQEQSDYYKELKSLENILYITYEEISTLSPTVLDKIFGYLEIYPVYDITLNYKKLSS
jgi:hypothetical protein